MKHDWNGPRSTLPRLTSPMRVPSTQEGPEAVRAVELALAVPRAAPGAERLAVDDGIARPGLGQGLPCSSQSRLRMRISRQASWSRTSSGRSMHPRADESRVATSSHRAKVIHYPDPVPTNDERTTGWCGSISR